MSRKNGEGKSLQLERPQDICIEEAKDVIRKDPGRIPGEASGFRAGVRCADVCRDVHYPVLCCADC